ncbi:TPA: hypothetical protein DDW35_12150, partial [Candidatus Sumerlaeota bacterium]|nr:hypothetical protein [Candidatus Sumerlaeota bacterium]
MTSPTSSRTSFYWGCLLIAVAAIVVFYPVWFAEFTWDDVSTISVDNLHPSGSLFRIWCKPSLAILDDYMPLNYTTNWVEYRLWGMNPRGYHLVNLALHILNAMLLFCLLRRIKIQGALLVALLFTIHPMQVSSIAWAVQRKDLLYVSFYLLAFLGWLRFEKKETVGNYLVVFALFAAAMLSKRMALTWPLAALTFCWWRTGQLEPRRVLQLTPLFIFAIALSYIVPLSRAFSVGAVALNSDVPSLSLLQKFLLAGNNFIFYIGKLLWPLEHVPIYPLWKIDPTYPLLYLAPISIAAGLGALWMLRNRIGRGPFAAVAFYG